MVAIAHHEAGHAYAAYKAGRIIEVVSISDEPGEGGENGKSRHFNPLYDQDLSDGDERLGEMAIWELIISYAGPEAEKRVDPAREVAASDLAEQRWILSCISDATPREAIDAYVRAVKLQTRQLVKEGWPAIQRIAAALLERGKLTGEEVKELVESE